MKKGWLFATPSLHWFWLSRSRRAVAFKTGCRVQDGNTEDTEEHGGHGEKPESNENGACEFRANGSMATSFLSRFCFSPCPPCSSVSSVFPALVQAPCAGEGFGSTPGALPLSLGDGGFAGTGLGGRGGLPAMMSPIWSESSVSHSRSAFVIISTLSRLSSRSFLASAYCSSMMRRISWSIFCIVDSEMFLCVVIERPTKTSPSFSP